MKGRLFLFLATAFLLLPSVLGAQSAWSFDRYAGYHYTTFEKFAPALEEINPDEVDIPLLNAAIFYETNRQRVLYKMAEFKASHALEKAATEHSSDMARLNFFSHTSLVKGKESMVTRLALVGISNAASAENIADSFIMNHPAGVSYQIRSDGYYYNGKKIRNRTYLEMGQAILEQWMNSPGHKKNILSPSTTYLGAGSWAYGKRENLRIKSTQNFSSVPGPLPTPSPPSTVSSAPGAVSGSVPPTPPAVNLTTGPVQPPVVPPAVSVVSTPPAPPVVAGAYKAGDQVQVQWKGRWFPSKVMRVIRNEYYISYDGYGEEWYEWVTVDRIKPQN